ncbi:MAG: twin-arginine translocation pathway signal protein [Sphaerotilus natans subsp. sulfidivorans]|uniref:Acg family FMN-binding oxidoreductase n=1 Tax=Sphaerotilus sulfidivorans TaxID=639200 RepID=UPI002355965B|nr:twin-arginine translocation pathway signal protein [Sphaerotilus sulfidivorans]MCK6403601.1 twin-arginine translocation pathway signal protein [Sphaerotilus sulfidivorans]
MPVSPPPAGQPRLDPAPLPLPRRRFIHLLGGGAVLAATGPLAGCSSAFPEEAVGPWREPSAHTDPRRFMLAHALLAPNPHNRQPWIADLRDPGVIHLICDGERLLPETDPYGRQILIGCGAFLELAVMAGAQRGLRVDVRLLPDGAPASAALPRGTRIATLTLAAQGSAAPDSLFPQILRRHTAKSAYDSTRTLPDGLSAEWQATARQFGLSSGVLSGDAAMAPIRRITREAYEIEAVTPATWLESARLMRIGPQAIATHRDGISMNSPFVRVLHGLGFFDPMEVPQRGQSSLARVMDRWDAFETGSGYLWLGSPGNDRGMQIAAGRAYVRMHLQATARGVDMHPLSQALQEFAAMKGPYDAIHRAVGLQPGVATLQMLSRVGYAKAAASPTPRRELATIIRT